MKSYSSREVIKMLLADGWYLVNYNGIIGYANGDFITLI